MRATLFAPLIIVTAGFSARASAEVTLHPIFTDGAVLQRDMPIPVWGKSTREGEKVTVKLAGKSVGTLAKGGKWRVTLPALPSGGEPLTLAVTGDNTVTVKDLLMGEVWVCSGQSNMDRQLGPRQSQKPLENWEQEMAAANYPGLRFFTVAKKISATPVDTVSGKWASCMPQTAKEFSAVGYFFGRDLHKQLGVPVGMIFSAWGGTPAEAWTSRSALDALPEMRPALAKHDKVMADYAKALAKFEREKPERMKVYAKAAAIAKDSGKPAPIAPPALPATPNNPQAPSVLRNGMITPLLPVAVRGVIWYQGESNKDRAKEYQSLFPALIADWRKDFGQPNMPFLFVQVAPFKGMPPEIREAQFLTLRKSPNTAMVVTTDVGDATDIHPTRKAPVSARLALAARAIAYGEKIEYSGPLYDRAKFAEGKATVSFTHTGKGLIAKDGDLKGFTLAGADGKFVPARAEIVGNSVIVSADAIQHPVAVRYGWANAPEVNLFNADGLPASPFRSDMK
ncbi:MAG TPA: sialate O-acetylesterase [Luteolibacter sp.]